MLFSFLNFSNWTFIPAPSQSFSSFIPSCQRKLQDWAWLPEQRGDLPLRKGGLRCHQKVGHQTPFAVSNAPDVVCPSQL